MSQYVIRLLKPIQDPTERQQVAARAAVKLGGSAEKLEQLIGRDPGSRIARAGTQIHANRVASILRTAGISVEVIAPELPEPAVIASEFSVTDTDRAEVAMKTVAFTSTELTALGASVLEESNLLTTSIPDIFQNQDVLIQTIPAPILNPTVLFERRTFSHNDPFAPPNQIPSPTGFLGTQINTDENPLIPNTKSNLDGFNTDPFAPMRSNDQVNNNDPFAPLDQIPLIANTKSSLDGFSTDPFAPMTPLKQSFHQDVAPAITNPVPEILNLNQSEDPFAAYGTNIGITVQKDELPLQARRARDRKQRRSTVRGQTMFAFVVPLIMVFAVLVGYLTWTLPKQVTRLIVNQAKILGADVASTLYSPMSMSEMAKPETIAWQARANSNASFIMVIDSDNTTVLAKAVDAGVNRTALEDVWTSEHVALEAEGRLMRIGGDLFVTVINPIQDAAGKRLGSVMTGLEGNVVAREVWSVLIPILVVLGLALCIGTAFAAALSIRLVRPIIAATNQANRISLGDLDQQIQPTSNDEISDLLNSLERMRVSLKSMVSRLRRSQDGS